MKEYIEKLDSVARSLTSEEKRLMENRKANRQWKKKSMAVALKIKRTLRIKGIAEDSFAEMMGVSSIEINRYLSGEANFDLKTIGEIERLLEIDLIETNIIDRKVGNNLQIKVTYQIALPVESGTNTGKEGDSSFIALDEKGEAIENLVRYA